MAAPAIHSSQQFQRILALERMRSDRSGLAFSVVLFLPVDEPTAEDLLEALAEIVTHRIRETDHAGWMKDDQLALALPYTTSSGAWHLADEICQSLPEHLMRPHCEVFEHPSRPDDLTDKNDPQQSNSDSPTDRDVEPAAGAPAPQVHAMRALFVRPMPWWKRTLDITVAGVALFLLSPLMLAIAACVRFTSPGPALFRQQRSGLGGRAFGMFKFRTMVADAECKQLELIGANEHDGPAFKIKDDPRVTPLGRWLRKTSLDELPQLINVLVGDMSLVGPRPLPCHESDVCQPWQQQRLDVTPGITCIWQVSGRTLVKFDNWMRMDISYIRRRSVVADFKLLVRTVWAVATCRGAQ